MDNIKWISKIVGKSKGLILALGIIQSLISVIGIVFSLSLRSAVDFAVAGSGELFRRAAFVVIIIELLRILLRSLNRYFEERSKNIIENKFKKNTFKNILLMDYKTASSYHSGEIMTRITSDSVVVAGGTVTLVPNLVSMIVKILGVLVFLYTVNPLLVLLFVCGGIVATLAAMIPRKILKSLHKKVQEKDGKVRSYLQEAIESLIIIHTFGCESKIDGESSKKMTEHLRVNMKRANVINFFTTLLSLGMRTGYLIGVGFCGYGILRGFISYGTLVAVMQLVGQVQTPLVNLGSVFPRFTAMLASAERLREFEKGKAFSLDNKRSEGKALYEKMESICFDNVSFSYTDDKPVLVGDTFEIKKGEFVAMIGSSGIGKSTIMKLMLSVYEPNSGKIYLQTNEKNIPVSELPSGLFAYVPQGNRLMSGTIKEVVGFSDDSDKIDFEKVVKSCKLACADSFIKELPNKYDTVLGEKGAGLSEGQMQRLAVARAIYSDCPILLLDEATSALDTVTEDNLMKSLKSLNRTVLLVSHRNEILELCDRILERKDGKINEIK